MIHNHGFRTLVPVFNKKNICIGTLSYCIECLKEMFKKKHTEADLVNGSVDGEMSRNTWICDDGVYHYCPVCDTLELCKDQEKPECRFSTFNGTHHLCYIRLQNILV